MKSEKMVVEFTPFWLKWGPLEVVRWVKDTKKAARHMSMGGHQSAAD